MTSDSIRVVLIQKELDRTDGFYVLTEPHAAICSNRDALTDTVRAMQ